VRGRESGKQFGGWIYFTPVNSLSKAASYIAKQLNFKELVKELVGNSHK
jgi:hypothetical protein